MIQGRDVQNESSAGTFLGGVSIAADLGGCSLWCTGTEYGLWLEVAMYFVFIHLN